MEAPQKRPRRRKATVRESVLARTAKTNEGSTAVETSEIRPLAEVDDDEIRQALKKFASSGRTGDGEDPSAFPTFDGDVERAASSSSSQQHANGEANGADEANLSKAGKKKARPTVAQLKQITVKPFVVEECDVSSPDPSLLVYLKSRRGTVPVPRHWPNRTKYLANKKGSDKIPYQLPDYIVDTGITKLRDTGEETVESVRGAMRDRVRPKMGKMDIDYQILYDAFFKHQSKPKLSRYGELYYEGKEFEKNFLSDKFVPGRISDDLRQALGMPPAAQAPTFPPPWLFAMQRFGPPPAYADMSFPGVNAPLPSGAREGMHFGGWGKRPLDMYGNPLYPDVGGVVAMIDPVSAALRKPARYWGELVTTLEDVEDNVPASGRRRAEEEEEEEVEEGGTEESATIVEPARKPVVAFAPPVVVLGAQHQNHAPLPPVPHRVPSANAGELYVPPPSSSESASPPPSTAASPELPPATVAEVGQSRPAPVAVAPAPVAKDAKKPKEKFKF